MKKWIFLLRSFLPKWTFFDDVAPELRLEVCFGKEENKMGEWQNALAPIRRSYKNLLVNSYGNYLHACHNHLNHFNSDLSSLADGADVEVVTTYQITKNMSRFQITDRGWLERPFYFQFRLVVDYSAQGNRPHDIVITSPVHEAP